MKQRLSNISLSNIITDILKNYNISDVCICPGSRNTPLVLSFTNKKDFKCTSYIDERAAGFFTLGISKASSKPSVILTTSGTAVANLLPSIIEADLSKTPMIAITADRPKSLLNTGENQTIKQDNIFKNFVRGSVHIDLSEDTSIDNIYRQIDSTIRKAVGTIGKNPPGPIHLNISFDEPLVDQETSYELNIEEVTSNAHYDNFMFPLCKYPLIVCGQLNDNSQNELILGLSEKLNCPILADSLSQLRFNTKHSHIFSYYDSYIQKLTIKPDYIIRFGTKPLSKKLNKFLSSYKSNQIISFSHYKKYNDNVNAINIKDIDSVETLNQHNKNLINHLTDLENESKKIFTRYYTNEYFFEGNILYHLIHGLKDRDNLFIGNSLPIRNLEKFCPNSDKKINIYSNRGASGIDGLIASALGASYHNKTQRNILILGDISFFYDMNALLLANLYNLNLNIIIINNNGGKILKTLPYSKNIDKSLESFWTTPIDLNIKESSKLYKANYSSLKSIEDIKNKLDTNLNIKGINIIEIECDFRNTQDIDNEINSKL